MNASPASSHTQEEQRTQNSKSTLPSAVGSCPSEEQPKLLEGLPHDMHHRAIVRRRDQWWEALKTKKPNIEACKGQQHSADKRFFNLKYH